MHCCFWDALLPFLHSISTTAIVVLTVVHTVGAWTRFLRFSSAYAGRCRARYVRLARTQQSVQRARDAYHA